MAYISLRVGIDELQGATLLQGPHDAHAFVTLGAVPPTQAIAY
jgi:hypothetical protein